MNGVLRLIEMMWEAAMRRSARAGGVERGRAGRAIYLLLLVAAFALAGCGERGGHRLSPTRDAATSTPASATASPTMPPVVQQTPRDLAQPGPYAAGFTRRTFDNTSVTTGAARPLNSAVWYPAEGAGSGAPREGATAAQGRFPAVLFSHGSGGVPEQSPALMQHLASYGFIVIAPPHPGNTVLDCAPCFDLFALGDSLINRPGDLIALLNGLAAFDADPATPLHNHLDTAHIAAGGHSFGGYTALVAAARDPRIHAVLALAPYSQGEVRVAMPSISVPTLIMNGDADFLTGLRGARQLFGALPASTPHGLIALAGGDHLIFTRPDDRVHRAAAAFLLYYLTGDAPAGQSLAGETAEFYGMP